MNGEMQELMQSNPEWYKDLQYQDVKVYIKDNINSASRSFVAIGYYLKYVRDNELFTEDGYSSIWEFAQAEYGISRSTASRFMAINDRFSVDGNSPILQEEYRDFSSSKLQEMLTLSDEQLERVTITTTRAEIREMKQPKADECAHAHAEPESIFPKVCKYDGKSNCVAICNTGAECCAECSESESCNSKCGWQEERIPKPSGTCIHLPEYPCTIAGASIVARADGENCPAKCCWNCPELTQCGYRCNASAHRPEKNTGINPDVKAILDRLMSEHYCALPVWKKFLEEDIHKCGKDEAVKNFFQYHAGQGQDIKADNNGPGYGFMFHPDDNYDSTEVIEMWHDNQRTRLTPDEFMNLLLRVKSCSNCLYNDMTMDEFDIMGFEGEYPCNICDDKLDQWTIKDESDPVETVEADIVQMEPDYSYTLSAESLLKTHRDRLSDYIRVDMSRSLIRQQETYVKALETFIESVSESEQSKQAQPDLPILRNNDQRKEFIEAYETWPIWIDIKETGERYYRYDFDNGDSIVAKVYYCKIFDYKATNLDYEERFRDGWGKKEYYLIESSKYFKDCQTNMTALIEYLKDYQKKK